MDIFYFWEGARNPPGYMELCLETWKTVPGATIRRIDYTNLAEITGGLVRPRDLARYPFAIQSDLVAGAVVGHRGGLFLDADTILLEGFRPTSYSDSRCTMYGSASKTGTSLAFVMSVRPGNAFISEWVRQAAQAMANISPLKRAYWDVRKRLTGKPAKVPWDMLGPAIIDPLLQDPAFSDFVDLRDQVSSGMYPYPTLVDAGERYDSECYKRIMFSREDRSSEILSLCGDGVLALQNSWHPPHFQSLSASEVLKGNSTLSRLLSRALAR